MFTTNSKNNLLIGPTGTGKNICLYDSNSQLIEMGGGES